MIPQEPTREDWIEVSNDGYEKRSLLTYMPTDPLFGKTKLSIGIRKQLCGNTVLYIPFMNERLDRSDNDFINGDPVLTFEEAAGWLMKKGEEMLQRAANELKDKNPSKTLHVVGEGEQGSNVGLDDDEKRRLQQASKEAAMKIADHIWGIVKDKGVDGYGLMVEINRMIEEAFEIEDEQTMKGSIFRKAINGNWDVVAVEVLPFEACPLPPGIIEGFGLSKSVTLKDREIFAVVIGKQWYPIRDIGLVVRKDGKNYLWREGDGEFRYAQGPKRLKESDYKKVIPFTRRVQYRLDRIKARIIRRLQTA